MDDDLAHLMARADPAETPLDAPISQRAMDDLARIMAGSVEPRRLRLRPRLRTTRWLLIPATAALAAAAVFAVQALAPNSPTVSSALAATLPPLAARGEQVPIAEAMSEAIKALDTPAHQYPDAPKRESMHEGWYADITIGGDGTATSAVITPQKTTFTWAEDHSAHLTVVAGESVEPAASGGIAREVEPPEPGTVLRKETMMAGEAGIAYPEPPPADPTELAAVLETNGWWADQADPALLVGALETLYNEWTLDRDQQKAVLEVLQSQPEFESIGTVTDRLGREGAAFVAHSADNPSMEDTLVVSLETGQVLSVEKTYVGGLPEFDGVVEAPAVVSYTAWTP